MCGRFSLRASAEDIKIHFQLGEGLCMRSRYNIAPGETIPVIKTMGELTFLRWGLIPAWQDAASGPGFVNARSETVTQKPSFREPFKARRCIVIADGYYEWKTIGRQKQPFYIQRVDGALFALAGIWTNETCAILTMTSSAFFADVHERMPVILAEDSYGKWLDKKAEEKDLNAFFMAPNSRSWQVYPVSSKMNHVKFDVPECVQSLS